MGSRAAVVWYILYGLVRLSEQQCSSPLCSCSTSGGVTTMSCNGLSAVPTITSTFQGVVLHFTTTTDIPTGAFKDLANVQTLTLTGQIGRIQTGAFNNIAGNGAASSEIRISGSVDSIEPNAFGNITGVQTLLINYCTVGTIKSSAFNTMTFPDVLIASSSVREIEPYAFDKVYVTNSFQVSRSNVSVLHPCGYGGVFGANEFRHTYSSINIAEDYAFGGMQHIVSFTMDNVVINQASDTTLKGMHNVHIDAGLQTNGNTLPSGFVYDGTTADNIKNNIRELCFNGYVTTTSTTTVPNSSSSTSSSIPASGVPTISSGPTPGATTKSTTPSRGGGGGGTPSTPSSTGGNGGGTTTTTSSQSNSTPSSGASTGEQTSSSSLGITEILLIVILVVLIIILILLVVLICKFKNRERNTIAPVSNDNGGRYGYNATKKASQPTSTSGNDGGFYFSDPEDKTTNSRENLVPNKKSNSGNKYSDEMHETSEMVYPETSSGGNTQRY